MFLGGKELNHACADKSQPEKKESEPNPILCSSNKVMNQIITFELLDFMLWAS